MMKKYILLIIRGFLIGIFSVIPGLSGCFLAYSFGDYERVINIIHAKVFNKETCIYLFTLIISFSITVLFISKLLLTFYVLFNNIFVYLIIIINVSLLNNLRKNIKIFLLFRYLIILGIIYIFLPDILTCFNSNYFLFIIAGFLYSMGKIIPGLSSTSFLIVINFYDTFLKFISSPLKGFIKNPLSWILFITSFLLTVLLFLKTFKNKNTYVLDTLAFSSTLLNTIKLLI